MKISFENLGIIKQAELDLSKKLLILCGPNGTGKTYASYLVYDYIKDLIPANLFDATELLEKKELQINLDYDKLYSLKKGYANSLTEGVAKLFGVQNKNYFSDFLASVATSLESFQSNLKEMSFTFTDSYLGCIVIYSKEKNSDLLNAKLDNIDVLEALKEQQRNIIQILSNARIGKYLCFQSLMNAYILPVERNSIYTFIDELAVNRIAQPEQILEKEQQKDRYPRPIQDALKTAADLKYIKNESSDYKWLAEEIENNILHGTVLVSEDGDLRFKPNENDVGSDKLPLPIHLSASIIKNISGLLIYLKHQAKENDLLIIDEPELGLHPDNQILLARIFARLINSKLRLLVSTHSDYIIRELNNLIMLSSQKSIIQEKVKKWGYKEDEKINPNDVDAYLFNFKEDNPNKVSVTPIPVTEEGFEVQTIDVAINCLNKISEDIFYTLKYGEESND